MLLPSSKKKKVAPLWGHQLWKQITVVDWTIWVIHIDSHEEKGPIFLIRSMVIKSWIESGSDDNNNNTYFIGLFAGQMGLDEL